MFADIFWIFCFLSIFIFGLGFLEYVLFRFPGLPEGESE